MLKHELRQSAVKADTVKGRNSRGWNSPWIAMLKHESWQLAVKADTVKSAIHVAKQAVNCDGETASAAM